MQSTAHECVVQTRPVGPPVLKTLEQSIPLTRILPAVPVVEAIDMETWDGSWRGLKLRQSLVNIARHLPAYLLSWPRS